MYKILVSCFVFQQTKQSLIQALVKQNSNARARVEKQKHEVHMYMYITILVVTDHQVNYILLLLKSLLFVLFCF